MKKITEQPAWSLAARHVEIRAVLREAVAETDATVRDPASHLRWYVKARALLNKEAQVA